MPANNRWDLITTHGMNNIGVTKNLGNSELSCMYWIIPHPHPPPQKKKNKRKNFASGMASYPDTTLRSLTITQSRRLGTARCCLCECQDDRVQVRVARFDTLFSSWPWLTGAHEWWRCKTKLRSYFQVPGNNQLTVKLVFPPLVQFPLT